MTKRRILCVTEYFYPHWTGLSKSFFSLVKEFSENGHDVSVLTVRFSPELPKYEKSFGLSIYRTEPILKISRTQYSPQSILEFAKLVTRADAVVINSPYSNILPISLLAKLMGKRLIIFHQGDLILAGHSGRSISSWIVERIFDLSTILSMWIADRISTYTEDYASHSRVMRHFMRKFSPVIPKIRLAGNSGGESRFKEKLAKLQEKYILVGFAGRFVEEKGFDLLFRAAPLVIAKVPNVKFIFAGETNVWYERFFDHTKSLIEENSNYFEFLGLLGDDDLDLFYRSLSLFVLPSRSDCFALTQAEAALRGVPVVVSDIPGARVMVSKTGFGEVVNSEDAESLAGAIVKVIHGGGEAPELREKVVNFLNEYDRAESLLSVS